MEGMNIEEIRKIVRDKPHILDSLPEFHRTVVMRLIGEGDKHKRGT